MSERQPLVQNRYGDESTAGYSAISLPEQDETKLSYNKVGLSPTKFWLLNSSLWVSSMLNAFDGVVVATLLGPISSSFHKTNMASWLGTSYMLSVCCITPIYGRLCNIIGRQASMLLALSIFTTGNFLCCIAPTMETLIAARALAGIGGGGLSAVGSTINSDIVPLEHRGIFQGLGNLAFGAGMGLGAPIGGIINDYLSWRWAFWIQIPILLVAAFLVYQNVRYTIPSLSGTTTPHGSVLPKQSARELFRRIDFLGCFLLAGWVGSALIALSLKTSSTSVDAYAWSDPVIIGLFSASGVLFLVFLLVELKLAAEPVMPFELLTSRTPVSVAINNFALSVANFACLYSVPLFFTAVRQMSASNAGAHLIPNSVVGMAGSLGCGLLVRKYRKYYWLNFWTGCVGVVGLAMIASWTENTPEVLLWTSMPLISFAMGAVTTLTIVGLIADVGPEHIAIATSLSYVFRTIGQVLGVSLSGALTQAVLQKELHKRITGDNAEEIITSIRESSQSIKYLPPALKAAAIASYRKALHAVFVCTVVLGVVYVISGLGITEVDMQKHGAGVKRPKPVDEEADGDEE